MSLYSIIYCNTSFTNLFNFWLLLYNQEKFHIKTDFKMVADYMPMFFIIPDGIYISFETDSYKFSPD